ncbi:MAG TPA: polysaccharide deacetylase family protein [Chitinophagaceae bacterium]|nr:polysaccharide deacetylase family protein [Chitinophagaceae bacterium]
MKKILFLFLFWSVIAQAQQSLQERLGYPVNSKLLIIHADDLGVSHSENEASFYALQKGSVNSGSIMVPCPWFPQVVAYAAAHPETDFGLHLTLTSEWNLFKWGPVAGKETVPRLVTPNGYFFESVDSVIKSAAAAEVEKELRAQIEKAKQAGLDFTHLDSHMGTLYSSKEYLQVLLKIGKEYRVPVMLNQQILKWTGTMVDETTVVINDIFIENPQDFARGAEAYYTGILQSLQPGVHEIILHAAYDNYEMQAITSGHPDYGAAWRQADFNFFTSERCKTLLQQNNIQLITWREIRDKLVRKDH